MFMVDRFGRKGLLLTSTVVSSLCVFTLGAYFYMDENKCLENEPQVYCKGGFQMELVDNVAWMPVVSNIVIVISARSVKRVYENYHFQVSIMLFIFFLSIGIGPLPWIMIGELFPEECKSASASLSAIVNQLMAFTTAKTVTNIKGSTISDISSLAQGYFSTAATNS